MSPNTTEPRISSFADILNDDAQSLFPSVTADQIDAILEASETTVTTVFDKVTIVTTKLPNGFVLVASSGAVSKENYSEEIGTDVCNADIRNQLWKLEGYALAKFLHEFAPVDDSEIPSKYKVDPSIPPHQQRVMAEHAELQERAMKLNDFIGGNPLFDKLDPEEQERMKVQNDIMFQLLEVLGARIAAF